MDRGGRDGVWREVGCVVHRGARDGVWTEEVGMGWGVKMGRGEFGEVENI